ncbi:MAG: inositol monophosphatase family protein [Oscillochloris sp.]|nr:inositol monophosphatase family protein [Oscillochloris sp.]
MAENYSDLLDFANQIAVHAGKITLRYFQSDVVVDRKADDSPVTIADREAEAYLREAIGGRFPDHAILGEEAGSSGPEDAEYRWILDPIDGTKSFIHGVPLYGVMIGLLRDGKPILGVVHMPALNEIVAAAEGFGCRWNGNPCRVSGVRSLHAGLVVATSITGYAQYGKDAAFQRILGKAGMFRTWADCYGYLLVATGRAEVALDPVMNIWDNAALLPILQEAGGTFTDWRGTATIANPEGLGTNGLVLDEVLELIADR